MGKGGVGKSTLSVLAALKLSLNGNRTRLVSLDPAHNLSDILEIDIGSKPKRIRDNLEAQEVDVDDWIRRYLKGIEKQLQSSYRYLSSLNLDKQFSTIKLAPGMEEYGMLLAMQDIIDKSKGFEYIIVDMPPTGLALRFFNLPRLSILWLEKLLELRKEILQKKEIIHKVRVGRSEWNDDKLSLNLEKQLQFYKKINTHWQKDFTSVNIVLNDDELSLREAQRLEKRLNEIEVYSSSFIINKCGNGNSVGDSKNFAITNYDTVPQSSFILRGIKNLELFLQKTSFPL